MSFIHPLWVAFRNGSSKRLVFEGEPHWTAQYKHKEKQGARTTSILTSEMLYQLIFPPLSRRGRAEMLFVTICVSYICPELRRSYSFFSGGRYGKALEIYVRVVTQCNLSRIFVEQTFRLLSIRITMKKCGTNRRHCCPILVCGSTTPPFGGLDMMLNHFCCLPQKILPMTYIPFSFILQKEWWRR